MPATFKSSVHKNIKHFFCIAITYKSCRNADDVGIIVFAGQLGQLFSPANGGSYAGMFISRYGNTIGTAA